MLNSSDVQGEGGGGAVVANPPPKIFLIFFLDDKTSAPDVEFARILREV